MIGHKRVPSREGGIEVVVEELTRRMVAQGHEVTLYNRRGGHVSGEQYEAGIRAKTYEGARIVRVPTPQSRSLNAVVYSFLASLHALLGGYDVIHYHAEGPSALLRIPSLFGKCTVSTVHGLDWQRGKWGGFSSKFLLFGEKTLAKKARAIIVLSESVQEYFRETYGRAVQFIPNGVNPAKPLPPKEIREKYGLAGGDYFLFLARLVPEKGIHNLLEAFSGVKTEKKLVIAGGGSHSDAYVKEIQARAARDPRVILTGFVQGRCLAELYSNCQLYVLPSDVEGMPLTLMEAMSYGRPCLISDIPENTAVAGAFAFSFIKGNTEDLREKLQRVADGRQPFPAPAEIAADLMARYNWDEVARKTLTVYQEALSKG